MPDMRSPQFPNQDKPVDSFIVGLISIAIAIPVTVFIASCFGACHEPVRARLRVLTGAQSIPPPAGIANDSEAPESWLEVRTRHGCRGLPALC